jgi:uncharacterized membrane protein YvbJ
MTPESCPNCGADIPRKAKACPECGADDSTGWSDEAHVSSLGLPDASFDYDEFAEREFGKKKALPYGIKMLWWVVAIGLVAIFIFGFFKWILKSF